MFRIRRYLVALTLLGLFASATTVLQAQAIINNGTIQLGVNWAGQLNVPGGTLSAGGSTTTVGLRYMPTNNASTEPGCVCEGWGAGLIGGSNGYANSEYGSFNVTPVSFTSAASTATSVVTIGGILEVTHAFAPSALTPNLYEVTVTLRNLTGAQLGTNFGDLRYARVMDWDIEPTAFSELVTIGGWGATNLLSSGTYGFASGSITDSGANYCGFGTVNTNFTKAGPCDFGAQFYFGFDPLGAGASMSFKIFYGAAANETAILAALGMVGAEVYSLGFCNPTSASCSDDGSPNVFAFGFAGVGGEALPNPTVVPEPATLVLLGTGMLGLTAARLRRRTGRTSV